MLMRFVNEEVLVNFNCILILGCEFYKFWLCVVRQQADEVNEYNVKKRLTDKNKNIFINRKNLQNILSNYNIYKSLSYVLDLK